jgi:hypothetical protein
LFSQQLSIGHGLCDSGWRRLTHEKCLQDEEIFPMAVEKAMPGAMYHEVEANRTEFGRLIQTARVSKAATILLNGQRVWRVRIGEIKHPVIPGPT